MNPQQEYYDNIKAPILNRRSHQKDFKVKDDILATTDEVFHYDRNNPRFAHWMAECLSKGHTPTQSEIEAQLLILNDLREQFRNSGKASDKIMVLPIQHNGVVKLLIVEGNSTLANTRSLHKEFDTPSSSSFDSIDVTVIDPSTFDLSDVAIFQALVHAAGKTQHSKYAQASLAQRLIDDGMNLKTVATMLKKKSVESLKKWLKAHSLHKQYEIEYDDRNEAKFAAWSRFVDSGLYDDVESEEGEYARKWFATAMKAGHVPYTGIWNGGKLKAIYGDPQLKSIFTKDGLEKALDLMVSDEPASYMKSIIVAVEKINKIVASKGYKSCMSSQARKINKKHIAALAMASNVIDELRRAADAARETKVTV